MAAELVFEDRVDAGKRLANVLIGYQLHNPLVLAIPRAGIEIGKAVADGIGARLDILLVRRILSPSNASLAIGAVAESGHKVLNDFAFQHASDAQIDQEIRTQMATMQRHRAEFTPQRSSISPIRRDVIIVDDGIATGATMLCAIQVVRTMQPRRIIAAAPVAALEAADKLRQYADQVCCVFESRNFNNLGRFYKSLPDVEEDVVKKCLREHDSVVARHRIQLPRISNVLRTARAFA
eukprot:TRINITY_DN7755_c0_g1_i1.p1 TRINITY_DN7755_c0_g1~~TRINITY_DN7755_c0_g1_i1.p1  ORF type:complete len:237 (-),score=36.33 TRINITY_DN7755_c0_g1_i1:254-964(-)